MLRVESKVVDCAAITHKGRRRANEDALLITPVETDLIRRGRLFAVADGMGGHNGGGLASRLACQGLEDDYRRWACGKPAWSVDRLRRRLEETMLRIDRQIRRRGYRHADLADMGTTLSCLVVTRKHAIVAHVGDSRIYRLRRGYLTCLTVDHTFVQDMIFEGEVDPARAAEHPLRHLLTRVVGTAEPLEWVDTRIDPIQSADRFLLCTDGLHNSLAPAHIALVLNRPWHARRMASTLVADALQAGARDNITAIVVKK